jgi:hypothetical protein
LPRQTCVPLIAKRHVRVGAARDALLDVASGRFPDIQIGSAGNRIGRIWHIAVVTRCVAVGSTRPCAEVRSSVKFLAAKAKAAIVPRRQGLTSSGGCTGNNHHFEFGLPPGVGLVLRQ